jgi:hypothetical protein
MAWIVGVDEAGYGPNLGPLVMTAVACRAPDALADADLWHALRPAVRRAADADDGRLLIDDSKAVYSATRGLMALEHGVLAALRPGAASVGAFLTDLCAGEALTDLAAETWYAGAGPLPLHASPDELASVGGRFHSACVEAGVGGWMVRSALVCTPRFNDLLDAHSSKGAVLGHALCELLRACHRLLPAGEALFFFIDKHGGRNAYSAMIQHALSDGFVVAGREGMAESVYHVYGLGRDVRLTFQPRADSTHFCVALASMTSKYLRERLMEEFNAFWQRHVPGLRATAGYPGDAGRYFDAIRAAAERLGVAADRLWRRK